MKVRTVLFLVVACGFLRVRGDMSEMPSCPPNEMFKNCLGNCSNCEERGLCATNCLQSGCDCWPRFFRLTPGGPCEPVAKCPKYECPENEVFRECGPLCERCGIFRCRVILCNHKCYCREGYRRDPTGECIPEKDCPQRRRCLRDEVMAESGPADEFCLQTQDVKTQDVRKCYCKPGFKRNFMGRCVQESLCEEVSCLGNEVYSSCAPACNTTCRNYGDPDCKEDDNCFAGCICRPGFALNDYHACVPLEECTEGRTFPADVTRNTESETTTTTVAADETSPEEATSETEETATKENDQQEKETTEQQEVVSSDTEETEDRQEEAGTEDAKEEEEASEGERNEPAEENVENPGGVEPTTSPAEMQATTEASKTKSSRRRSSKTGHKKQAGENEK